MDKITTMSLTDICKNIAVQYSTIVSKPCYRYGNEFPEYFDWADHIAGTDDYPYHLNQVASDVEKLVDILTPPDDNNNFDDYSQWRKNWHCQTVSAAWIHDIGMIKDREKHGLISAQFLFENYPDLSTNGIEPEDKIKIALLCIKHNNDWDIVYESMKTILIKNEIDLNELDRYFINDQDPVNELNFSGRLISTADSLRHRGKDLRNNLGKKFSLWSYCKQCETFYHQQLDECCTYKTENKAVIEHHNSNKNFNSNNYSDIKPYQVQVNKKKCAPITGNLQTNNYFVPVRNDFQIFTLGDMSLSDVSVEDYETWHNTITAVGINVDVLNNFNVSIDDNYKCKTVISVTIDIENIYAAMFTLSKYIIAHLHKNIATNTNDSNTFFANKVIFHITIATERRFAELYHSFIKNDSDEVQGIKNSLEVTFQEWGKLVLPVQVIDKKLEVVTL